MTVATNVGSSVPRERSSARWVQLVLWTIAMMAVGTWQYGWTLYVGPIDAKHQWGRAAIQVAFTVFIVVEAFSTVPIGALLDRFGSRAMVLIGGCLLAASGLINSKAETLMMLYIGSAVGGVGVGIISCGAPNGALQWFPNNRGLAAGTVVTGFVTGSLFTVLLIGEMIKSVGYMQTFFWVGLLQGGVLIACAFFLRSPKEGEVPKALVENSERSQSEPREAVRSGAFWVLFAIFTLVGAGGLMVTAQFASIANDYKVANVPVTFLGITAAALPFAIVFDRVMNGACRPIFGGLSDKIGRENTMFLAFGLEAVSIFLFIQNAHDPLLFVLLSGVIFFAWGEIFSLMPTTVADIFGAKNATTIYGLLYAAKGVASIAAPLSNVIMSYTGSWHAVFYIVVVMDICAALLALFVLKPLRRKYQSVR